MAGRTRSRAPRRCASSAGRPCRSCGDGRRRRCAPIASSMARRYSASSLRTASASASPVASGMKTRCRRPAASPRRCRRGTVPPTVARPPPCGRRRGSSAGARLVPGRLLHDPKCADPRGAEEQARARNGRGCPYPRPIASCAAATNSRHAANTGSALVPFDGEQVRNARWACQMPQGRGCGAAAGSWDHSRRPVTSSPTRSCRRSSIQPFQQTATGNVGTRKAGRAAG